MKRIADIYRDHRGKLSDKWTSNIEFYDNLFEKRRADPVRILEIGIQNGGSLEIWSEVFPNAQKIVGCDIDEKCRNLKYTDPKISVVVGDATTKATQDEILSLCDEFDIIIEDGSHRSSDIIKAFAMYFGNLSETGMFIAEDLHCSYWQEYEGGVEDTASALSFFRRLTDFVNFEHWGAGKAPSRFVKFFEDTWGARFLDDDLLRIREVTFSNSLVAVSRSAPEQVNLGIRVVVGEEGPVVDGEPLERVGDSISQSDQSHNKYGPHAMPREQAALSLEQDIEDLKAQHAAAINELEKQHIVSVNEAKRQYSEMVQHLKIIEHALFRARKRPWKLLSTSIRFRIAEKLRKRDGLFSEKWLDKLANSAAKRHPSRGLLFVDKEGRVGDNPGTNEESTYQSVLKKWAIQREAQAEITSAVLADLRDGPLISVVVPVYNPDVGLMREMIASVQAQSYPNWELCIADDCSSDPEVRATLKRLEAEDDRIRVVYREENGHISAATNSAIEIAKGAYLAFVDHDDLLDQDALLWVVKTIHDGQDVRIVYTDEDKVRADGTRYDPHFKPDWNQEFLQHINYISHLGVYQADMVRRVGALRVGFEGAQDYDLLLRCTEGLKPHQIVHIPKVLYSWRATEGSTAESLEAKPYASQAGERALAEHLSRVAGKHIPVEAGPMPFTYRAIWPVENDPLVSIIIPTKDKLEYLRKTVDSIVESTTYQNFEIWIVDNGSTEQATLTWLEQIQTKDPRVHVLRDERPFNYSALNNAAVSQSRGEIIALVNNDIEVIDPDWLREMVSLAQRPDVGCVGAKLHYPDGRIQHAGVVIGMGGVAGHVHLLAPQASHGYFARLALRQEYGAVTAACLVLRREIFEAVGGLNETELTVAFNDVDLCLKVQEAGYRNLWTPWARLYHHESVSRGPEDNPAKQARFAKEIAYMETRWSTRSYHDPAYNPNLSLTRQDFGLAPAKWTPL